MENPLSSPDSQPKSLSEPATDNTSPVLNEAVKLNEPQIITEPAEESRPQNLDKQTKDHVPQDLNEPVKLSKPLIIVEPPEESGPPDLNELVKLSKPLIIVEPPEESRLPDLNEQDEDSEPQDQPTEDHRLQDLNEDSKRPDLNQFAPDSTAQDLKNEAEAQGDAPPKMSLDKEESPLPSSSKGQEITTTDDATAPKPSLDDNAQGLPEPATDHQPQALDAPIETVVEQPERHPQDEKETPSRTFTTGVQGKTIKTEKVEETPGSCENKRCSHTCGHSSHSAKPMFSWSPTKLAKATLRPKQPQTYDKATQILPGRVPMLPKPPPKRGPPPKPKPPSADKATEISPSFEKLLKRPPPLVMKKKKKEEMSPMTMTCQHGTSSPNRRQSFSTHRGRSPRTAANSSPLCGKSPKIRPLRVKSSKSGPLRVKKSKSGPLRVKSSKSGPLHVKSSKSGPLRVKSSKSGPLRVKSSKSGPLRVKSLKSMPLRVKLASSSPSKHRLNLCLCPREKRKIICNLYLTFCDNWEEPQPCCLRETLWEESLSSCSGLYRACSVFSNIKYGRIHVSNLLLALHTLGILVTSEEMHHILRLINVDAHETLNFCTFLEAVNTTSPFTETAAFQNTLKAFRKMKKGTVGVKELEPILQYLGVTLSPETLQQTLGLTQVNKNGKFDISDFMLAAKDLQRIFEEEDEAFLNERAIFKRRPFQDVTDLVDAEYRRRRKYCDCFEEEMPMPTRLRPLLMWPESDEDRTSNTDLRQSSSASPVNTAKEEVKYGDALEVTTSQMGLSSDLKSSSHESLANNAKRGNKDNDAMELGRSQVEPPSQNTGDPVPA